MTRAKHGAYDASKHLPDNRGKPTGSGLYVWLCNEVEQRYGNALVEEAQTHGDRRYRWLIEQLEVMEGDEEAKRLVEEFHARRKADAAEQRQQERRRRLASMQARIDSGELDPTSKAWLEKEIQKVQRSIEKAQAQQ